MLTWNELGVITLLVSSIMVIFSLIIGLAGISIKLKFQLIRILLLELLVDKKKVFKFYKMIVGFWEFLSLKLLSFLKINKNIALRLSQQAIFVNFFLAAIALLILLIQLYTNDLTSKYVVNHSSDSLSIFYRLTAAWAGSSGSLLFWYFLLTLFSALVLYKDKLHLYNRLPIAIIVLGSLQFLFIFLMLFYEDAQPFLEYHIPMKAGRGLNPLLLHWAMIIHPPILYIGYVSFAIPFTIYISAVISGNMKDDLMPLFRRWTLFSWFFLGFGILLGSKWAYEELGWGGYWAWDPVENASLMPFILSTAFLHSLIVQHHRGMLKYWNLLLITLTYHFCLLGTWITRSGVIEGPHSFAKSDIGIPMIIFIGLSFLYFVRFLYFKRNVLKPKDQLEAVTSKEGSILLNNFIMLISVLIVLIGVFSPLIPYNCTFENGFQCFKTEWKPTTYNKIMVPIGILILFLMGASPLLAWRKPMDIVFAKTLKKPIIAGIWGGIIYAFVYFFYLRPFVRLNNSPWGFQIIADIFSILTVSLGIFIVAGIIQEYYRAIHARKVRLGETTTQAIINLIRRNQRRYGGYLVHLAVVFLFIGYSGGAFKTEYQIQFHYYLMPTEAGSPYVYYYSGDKAYIQGYTIEARELFIRPYFEPNADPSNPIYMTVSQEAHYRINPKEFLPVFTISMGNPYDFANQPPSLTERLLKFSTGFILDGRMTTERRFYPQVYPYTGELIRNEMGFGERLVTSEPDIKSSWTEDLYIQVGSVFDPIRNRTPDIASMFEYYYYELNRDSNAYSMLFPSSLVVDLHIWINPLVKFIWFGTTLFFLSGLIVLLPIIELKNKE